MARSKPYSPACEENQAHILAVLKRYMENAGCVLEIGSGTGQHACFFAEAMPQLQWQTSDQAANIEGIQAWLDDAGLSNTPPPLTLDVNGSWPTSGFDAAFSANCFHIMDWPAIESTFRGLSAVLASSGRLIVYGPFNYNGRYTSESNARFDQWLRMQAPHQGVRDFEAINRLASAYGFKLKADIAMPANNRCLIWDLVNSTGA